MTLEQLRQSYLKAQQARLDAEEEFYQGDYSGEYHVAVGRIKRQYKQSMKELST